MTREGAIARLVEARMDPLAGDTHGYQHERAHQPELQIDLDPVRRQKPGIVEEELEQSPFAATNNSVLKGGPSDLTVVRRPDGRFDAPADSRHS